jgi:serine/threonine protein kinase
VLMDETAGTVASEIWSLAATVYSLLAGRSPCEIPGESNKSADLVSRINRAKIQPIGRSDVPADLERMLQRAMSRRPENRQQSVLEFVHEIQAIETELGVPQTPIEVAMDDWALATVADLEDRTRVRGVASAASSTRARRRRRVVSSDNGYASVGTLHRHSSAAIGSGMGPVGRSRGMRALAWGLVATSVLVIALAATATLVLIRANNSDIPQVANITSVSTANSIEFSWNDPGLEAGDSYQVTTADGGSSLQKAPRFSVDATLGDRVCVAVAVNRGGKLGPSSGEKCVDVPG